MLHELRRVRHVFRQRYPSRHQGQQLWVPHKLQRPAPGQRQLVPNIIVLAHEQRRGFAQHRNKIRGLEQLPPKGGSHVFKRQMAQAANGGAAPLVRHFALLGLGPGAVGRAQGGRVGLLPRVLRRRLGLQAAVQVEPPLSKESHHEGGDQC